MIRIAKRSLILSLMALTLSACNMLSRVADIGREPELSAIQNPAQQPGYQPVTMPMPRPQQITREPNSLWRPGARAFFKDQRASRVGDILTVNISIEDEASISNETNRSRTSAENADLAAFLGLESKLATVLPDALSLPDLVDFDSGGSSSGSGTVDRTENISLTVGAVVSQVLPNGNLVIQGRQEVRVNFEVRELVVSGVVRPEDITNINTIQHTQIAEARIAYGGRGQLTDMQQPRYGQQLFDIVFPF